MDVTGYLQAAIDYAKANGSRLRIPAGKYRITETLWATRSPFESAVIEGDGRGYDAGARLSQTEIEVRQTDRPGLAVQYGRGVVVRGILFVGQNTAPEALSEPVDDAAAYISPSCRASRYSPYCGICIDPAVGSVPPDGGYPGFTYANGTGGSADLLIENVGIRNFVVGIMCSPDGSSSQGDVVRIVHPQITRCDSGISWGQSQARANVVSGGNISSCRVALNGIEHGWLQAAPPLVVSTQIIFAYRAFAFPMSFGPLRLIGTYTETLKQLGRYGLGWAVTRHPLLMEGCHFCYNGPDWSGADPVLLETHAPTLAQGCVFNDNHAFPEEVAFTGLGRVELRACTVKLADDGALAHPEGRLTAANCWAIRASGGEELQCSP